MSVDIKNYLKRPFPYFENGVHKILISVFFSILIFIFLLIFRPSFGEEQIAQLSIATIAALTAISLLCLLINLLVVPILFKSYFNPITWNIEKTIIFTLIQFVVISFANYLFLYFFESKLILFLNLFSVTAFTTLIGFVPSLLLIVYIEKHQQFKNYQAAQMLNKNIAALHTTNHEHKMVVWASNRIESLELLESQLLYIKSEGNYVRIVYQENNILMSKFIRNSLNTIETDLSPFDLIKRVHRSYLVNLNAPLSVMGNSKNCYIQLQNFDISIPISRSFYKNFPIS